MEPGKKMNKKFPENSTSKHSGIAMLVTMIVVGAAALAVVIGIALVGIDETRIQLHQSKSLEVSSVTDGCIEEALIKLNGNRNYAADVFNSSGIECTISITGEGNNRIIRAVSAYEGTYSRKIEAGVNFDSNFKIIYWREVTN